MPDSRSAKARFKEDEIKLIQELRHYPTKDIVDLFPGRSLRSVDYLRQRTGAYRIYRKKQEAA